MARGTLRSEISHFCFVSSPEKGRKPLVVGLVIVKSASALALANVDVGTNKTKLASPTKKYPNLRKRKFGGSFVDRLFVVSCLFSSWRGSRGDRTRDKLIHMFIE